MFGARFSKPHAIMLAAVGLAAPLVVRAEDRPSPGQDRAQAAPPAAGAARTADGKPVPAVLIGPSRVTLVSGRTVDGIAVFQEPTRVRVVLEDGKEISFEPSVVSSVQALADIEEPPAAPTVKAPKSGRVRSRTSAAPTAARSVAGRGKIEPRSKPAEGASPGSGATTRAKAHGSAASSPTVKTQHGSTLAKGRLAGPGSSGTKGGGGSGSGSESLENPPGTGGPTSAGGTTLSAAKGDLEASAAPGPGTSSEDRAPSLTDDDVAALAAMITHGVEAAELEEQVEAAQQAAADARERAPRPEEFDATRPVVRPGFRFVGRKKVGALDEDEPVIDFPKPAPPAVSLGASMWQPTDGFRTTVRWASRLQPATSFPTTLSGLGKPTTSLGPTYFTPPPVTWPQSIFPDTWVPTDGFAKSKPQK